MDQDFLSCHNTLEMNILESRVSQIVEAIKSVYHAKNNTNTPHGVRYNRLKYVKEPMPLTSVNGNTWSSI